ncbi:unnamed protein product [Phyllotreta striolata]|uniref:Structure-specific endonuclease subunit SLX4 n=1 Tax=Phyllotreta striolata TaxID=444603 RepID=A0A9N9TPW8_PHYSR|nr:unnamed protein product [Phyllotreta striolata]
MPRNWKTHGSSKCSSQSQKSNDNCPLDKKLPGTSKDSESPYKNILHGINRVSLANDANDFASPKVPKKKSAPKKPVLAKKKTPKKGNKKKINPILKCFEDNSENIDVNPDHLQMALALSRSTFAQENPGGDAESQSSILTAEKIPKVTTFLEKYGFKCNRTQANSKSRLEETKKKKNSKFRFVTPALYTRSEEDRISLINSKVIAIIEEQNQFKIIKEIDHSKSIKSSYLKQFQSTNKCWNINNALFSNEFIISTLNLDPSENTAGCLLKNWDDIQGRDKSPQPNPLNKETAPQILDDIERETKNKRICSSPDLFDDSSSDSLIFTNNELEITPHNNSQIEISPSKLQTFCTNEPDVSPQSVDQPTCSIEIQKKPTKTGTINFDSLLPKVSIESTIVTNSKVPSEFESTYFKDIKSVESSPKQDIEQYCKGIEHYESFYEPTEKNNEFIDLTYSSDEDQSCETSDFNKKNTDQDQHEETVQASNARPSLITKRSSLDSGNISLEYNRTKSLNVTDYVLQVLNSQDMEEIENNSKSSLSQESTEIVSDEELNYSSRFSESCVNPKMYDLETVNDCHDFDDEDAKDIHDDNKKSPINDEETASVMHKIDVEKPEPLTSDQACLTPVETKKPSLNLNTPDNIIIKTHNVTPMADYDAMDTPKIQDELDKFGIKPLKRRRGVELLKYIYESSHPIVDINAATIESPVKRRKLNPDFENQKPEDIKIVGATLTENENDDLLFERRFSKKIASCRVPLQIAWYNFLCCNPVLKENILLYEPIQLEVVVAMLNDQSGCKFHIEDLISFFDKKCITFRTNQWKNGKKRNPTKLQD